jgi:hypothetical protein
MSTTTAKYTGTENGVWSSAAGGFIMDGIYTATGADEEVKRLIVAGEDPGDLEVVPFCSEHRDAEQPEDGCELCDEDEDEDEDDEETS